MTQETTLSQQQAVAILSRDLPDWEYRDNAICRHYKSPDWPHTLMLVNTIGYVAQAAFHHPDLAVSYASVDVKLTTHSAGGVTEKDMALAMQIEKVATWKPEKDSPLSGFEQEQGRKWIR